VSSRLAVLFLGAALFCGFFLSCHFLSFLTVAEKFPLTDQRFRVKDGLGFLGTGLATARVGSF
jgi:hypothetical protein